MNSFYSRFDTHDFRKLHIEEKDVLRAFQCTKVRKSPGADGISGQGLKNCATQLPCVFYSIFQTSLNLQKIPTLWKMSIVVPVPKKSHPNDFRPIVLTSHVMKSFEKIFIIETIGCSTYSNKLRTLLS